MEKIPINTTHVCPFCEKIATPDGKICFSCKKKSPLDGLITAASYKNQLIARSIHYFKYRFIPELSQPLGHLSIKALQMTDLPIPDSIMPVPLHKRRLRWRGYNQSQLLASYVCKNLISDMPVHLDETTLVRTRYTKPQMKLSSFQQRSSNIKGSFACTGKDQVVNKKILLVDDVATTGSTLFECARVLKRAGAREVYGIVIARQELKSHQQ